MIFDGRFRPPSRAWMIARNLILLAVAVLVVIWRAPAFRLAFQPNSFPPGKGFFLPDFFQEWASARNYLEGLPIYTPHEITVARYFGWRIDANSPYFMKENAHPPSAALLGLPFAFLDFRDALVAWNLLSLLFLAISAMFILQAGIPRGRSWHALAGCSLFLCGSPLEQQMVQGQLTLLLLLLIALAWWADRNGYLPLAGISLGAAGAIKLLPGFILLYFIYFGKWRAVSWAAVAFCFLSVMAGILFGFDAYHDYFLEVLPRTSSAWRTSWHNLSLPGIWFKLFEQGEFFPPIATRPLIEAPILAWGGAALSLCLLAGLAWLLTRCVKSPCDNEWAYCLMTIMMLLISPIEWSHYLLLLTLPILLLWSRLCKPAQATLVCLLAILWLSPAILMPDLLNLIHCSFNAGPWQSLVVLSLPCYAQLGILGLAISCRPTKSSIEKPKACGALGSLKCTGRGNGTLSAEGG